MAEQRTEFTEEELKAAKAQIRQQEMEKADQFHRELAERAMRITAELDEKYRTEAGMTPEEWDRIQDIIYRYREEMEQHGL